MACPSVASLEGMAVQVLAQSQLYSSHNLLAAVGATGVLGAQSLAPFASTRLKPPHAFNSAARGLWCNVALARFPSPKIMIGRDNGSCNDQFPVASVSGEPVVANDTHASMRSSDSAFALASLPQNSARYSFAAWFPPVWHAQQRAHQTSQAIVTTQT